jgi:triphosphatase
MSPTETEIKFSLAPRAVDSFASAGLLAGVAPRRSKLDNVYFDTPDFLLRTHGLALRLRNDDGSWLQTLKTTGGAGALASRGEWEGPAAITTDGVQLDFDRLRGSPLPALLHAHRAELALAPKVRTRFTRTRWICRHRQATIEVALDEGRVSALVPNSRASAPICEVELELLSGPAQDLVDFARELLASRDARRWHLLPATESKAERGFRLGAEDPSPPVVKASARGFIEPLDARMPAARALREVVRHGTGVLAANAEGLRVAASPEHVHQARVALRRMRSAIRLLDREADDFPAKLAARLHALARTLGDARDWDVMLEQTLPALARTFPSASHNDLVHQARGQHQRARRHALRAVSTLKFTRLVLALEAWCFTTPPVSASLQASSRRLLAGAADCLFDATAEFDRLCAKRRHRVRILAKRLRYALDLLSVALPVRTTRRYIDALANVQDVLGELNDAVVAAKRLAAQTPGKTTQDLIDHWFGPAQHDLVAAAHAKLVDLQAWPRPWERRSRAATAG